MRTHGLDGLQGGQLGSAKLLNRLLCTLNLLAIALHLDRIAGALLRGPQGVHAQLIRCLWAGDFAQSHTSI